MERLKSFVKTSLLGGFLVVLPVALSLMVLTWLYKILTGFIQPLTDILVYTVGVPEMLADITVVLFMLLSCFVLGIMIRTRLGAYLYRVSEAWILKRIPGYGVIKETVQQLFGGGRTPFTRVAVVRLFGGDTRATGFITDEHEDGSYTVFVPTGPNPTSGFIYHLRADQVSPVDHPADDAMRTIISCGVGSRRIVGKAGAR